MLQSNKIIILHSGASIRQNKWDIPVYDLELWDKIKDCLIISINWGYKFCNPTIEVFSDFRFYALEHKNMDKSYPKIGFKDSFYDSLERHGEYFDKIDSNTFLLPPCKSINDGNGMRNWFWGKESWDKGFYTPNLSGLFALTLAIVLGGQEIYLLGADWGDSNGYTHFYQDDGLTGKIVWNGSKQTGIGKNENGDYKTSRYNSHRDSKVNIPEYWYKPYLNEDVNIYNVSESSNLNLFPKISYDLFYDRIKDEKINREELQLKIKKYISEKLEGNK